MRLPLAIPLDSRDGLSDQDGRLVNMVVEQYEDKLFVEQRPALSLESNRDGAANGIYHFNGQLISAWGTALENYVNSPVIAFNSATTYAVFDTVFFDGSLWVSLVSGNQGNTPSYGSIYWGTDPGETTWTSAASYSLGDSVIVFGVDYYSTAPANTGNLPPNQYKWQTTPLTSSRWQGDCAGYTGAVCGSIAAASYSAWEAYPYRSCATKSGAMTYVTYVSVGTGLEVIVNQWVDPAPSNCSATQLDLGIANYGTVVQVA